MAVLPYSRRIGTKHLRLTDLASDSFVLFHREGFPSVFDTITGMCNNAGFSPRVENEPNLMQTVLSLVEAEQGVAIIPARVTNLRSNGVRFYRVQPDGIRINLVVAWKKENQSVVLQAFLDLIDVNAAWIRKKAEAPEHIRTPSCFSRYRESRRTVAMSLLVTSASGANGDGFGALLSFELDGALLGTFIDDDRIVDPRGLAVDPKENLLFLNSGADRVVAISSSGRIVRDTGRIEGLNPGGGNFGPDGWYFVGLRSERTIAALSTSLDAALEHVLPPGVVPFPRGFAFGHDGRLFLASGIGPSGQGDNTILAFPPAAPMNPSRLVADPELSPLDLAIAPNGNIVVSSERPFGAVDAVTSVRESARAKFAWLAVGETHQVGVSNCQHTGRIPKVEAIPKSAFAHIDCVQIVH